VVLVVKLPLPEEKTGDKTQHVSGAPGDAVKECPEPKGTKTSSHSFRFSQTHRGHKKKESMAHLNEYRSVVAAAQNGACGVTNVTPLGLSPPRMETQK
jgi:hypothetical protein